MSASRLATLVESLRSTIEGLDWAPVGTVWADYAEHTSYDDAATAAKEAAVAAALAVAGGSIAWDLGANTGRYSRLAAERGYRVVALDVDPGAVERHYRRLRDEGRTDILPLLADLTNPSPAQGWGSAERASLLSRADADVSLALALVHHLAIGANVPLPMIAALFARMAPSGHRGVRAQGGRHGAAPPGIAARHLPRLHDRGFPGRLPTGVRDGRRGAHRRHPAHALPCPAALPE